MPGCVIRSAAAKYTYMHARTHARLPCPTTVTATSQAEAERHTRSPPHPTPHVLPCCLRARVPHLTPPKGTNQWHSITSHLMQMAFNSSSSNHHPNASYHGKAILAIWYPAPPHPTPGPRPLALRGLSGCWWRWRPSWGACCQGPGDGAGGTGGTTPPAAGGGGCGGGCVQASAGEQVRVGGAGGGRAGAHRTGGRGVWGPPPLVC